MHVGKRFTVINILTWTRRHIFVLFILALAPTILFHCCNWKFLALPWQPIALLGTAVSFIVGFKNNASYGRLWEARQIYGAIINNSRAYGSMLKDFIADKKDVMALFKLQFAWLTALRYQLREPKEWENMSRNYNQEFQEKFFTINERLTPIEKELEQYLTPEQLTYFLSKKNKATQLLAKQSEFINELHRSKKINDFQQMQLQTQVSNLYDQQGKVERIKNFPYPRNFSSITSILLRSFVVFTPYGLITEFEKLGDHTFLEGYTIWLNVIFATLVAWVFVALDLVGESSMNPFEGNANDIPITQISRMIEIDMLDMLDEANLPKPIAAQNNILL